MVDGMLSFDGLRPCPVYMSNTRKGQTYHVGNTLTDDGVWTSDHRPVFSNIELLG